MRRDRASDRRIRFEYDDSWVIAKWDDSAWYRERIERLKGTVDGKYESTKAVDAVGMRDDVPYLFEVKDFRDTTTRWDDLGVDDEGVVAGSVDPGAAGADPSTIAGAKVAAATRSVTH